MKNNATLKKVANFDLVYYIKIVENLLAGKECNVSDVFPRKDCYALLSSLDGNKGRWTKKYPEFFTYLSQQVEDYAYNRDRNFKKYEFALNLFHHESTPFSDNWQENF